jgi:hypothetical protein
MMKHFALVILSLHLLFSCSVNYHLNKAIKKGYRCDEVGDTIRITSVDSIPYIVNDSIVWEKVITQKDTIIRYKTSFVPKTRYEIRFDNKRFNDSLKHIRKVYTDSLEAAIKINKQDNKTVRKTRKKSPNLFLLGFITGIFSVILIRYAINQALKKYT